jgi:ABC-2 type transport system ATP-binding protein
MLQRLGLAATLVGAPDVLLLDEPASALDPAGRREVLELIGRLRGQATVLLSSHILAEVEHLCDRVSIIRAGRCVESGTLTELRHLTRTTVRAETSRTVDGLGDLDGVHDLLVEGRRVAFEVDTSALPSALAVLQQAGLATLTATPPTLEELFMRHYGDDVTAGAGEAGS